VAEEACIGRVAGDGGFYWRVGRRTPPAGRRILVVPADRIHSVCCGEERRRHVECLVAVTNLLQAIDAYVNLKITIYDSTENFLYSGVWQSVVPQNSQSVQRFRTLTDNVADVVWCWQVVAEGNTEDFERGYLGDVGERRRQGFQLISPVVAEEDFCRLRLVQA